MTMNKLYRFEIYSFGNIVDIVQTDDLHQAQKIFVEYFHNSDVYAKLYIGDCAIEMMKRCDSLKISNVCRQRWSVF